MIDKADVVNITVLSFVALIVIMVLGQLWIAGHNADPMSILLDLRGWFIPLVSGIFLAYGITKGQTNQQ
jgi:uncharacterized membrane protein